MRQHMPLHIVRHRESAQYKENTQVFRVKFLRNPIQSDIFLPHIAHLTRILFLAAVQNFLMLQHCVVSCKRTATNVANKRLQIGVRH